MLGGFAIILLFLFAGELIGCLGVPLPGNVIGMILLTAALALRLVKAAWIRPAAEFLVDNLSMLFVPAGVGVMAYFDVISRAWLPIALSVVVSTLVVIAFTGVVFERIAKVACRLRGGKS